MSLIILYIVAFENMFERFKFKCIKIKLDDSFWTKDKPDCASVQAPLDVKTRLKNLSDRTGGDCFDRRDFRNELGKTGYAKVIYWGLDTRLSEMIDVENEVSDVEVMLIYYLTESSCNYNRLLDHDVMYNLYLMSQTVCIQRRDG